MDIENLSRQHHDIFALVNRIRAYSGEDQIRENAAVIAKTLAQLSGIIKMHLLAEDKFVYPVLRTHVDSRVCNAADAFAAEMGELASVFTAYKSKYLIAGRIAEDAAAFFSETTRVFAALEKRINKEERELYPLVQ